ncbi:hypothetical protein L0Y40_01320 [Candidatus Wolfebacteria bacterium]|nr:hypothetical protein [Candidatus Wolfebacteria bacterium]
MLYVLYGTDTEKAREKVRGLVASLTQREPNAAEFRLDADSCNPDALAEYLGAQGLFSSRVLVVLDRVFENDEAKELIVSHLADIADSENIFVLLESDLDKKTLARLERHAERVQEYEEKSGNKKLKGEFNIFSLTDALGNRDSDKLWVLYQKALRAGIPSEEMQGILFWQLKTLVQVAGGDTAGLKPFVVGKAKRFLAHYSPNDVRALTSRFISLYHNARRGAVDFELGLEQLMLSLS